MSVRERIKQLRAEARDLERASDLQERSDSYAAALQHERHGYEHRLLRARQLGDEHERVSDWNGNYVELEKSGTQQAVELEARIAGVDAELARCGPSARPS